MPGTVSPSSSPRKPDLQIPDPEHRAASPYPEDDTSDAEAEHEVVDDDVVVAYHAAMCSGVVESSALVQPQSQPSPPLRSSSGLNPAPLVPMASLIGTPVLPEANLQPQACSEGVAPADLQLTTSTTLVGVSRSCPASTAATPQSAGFMIPSKRQSRSASEDAFEIRRPVPMPALLEQVAHPRGLPLHGHMYDEQEPVSGVLGEDVAVTTPEPTASGKDDGCRDDPSAQHDAAASKNNFLMQRPTLPLPSLVSLCEEREALAQSGELRRGADPSTGSSGVDGTTLPFAVDLGPAEARQELPAAPTATSSRRKRSASVRKPKNKAATSSSTAPARSCASRGRKSMKADGSDTAPSNGTSAALAPSDANSRGASMEEQPDEKPAAASLRRKQPTIRVKLRKLSTAPDRDPTGAESVESVAPSLSARSDTSGKEGPHEAGLPNLLQDGKEQLSTALHRLAPRPSSATPLPAEQLFPAANNYSLQEQLSAVRGFPLTPDQRQRPQYPVLDLIDPRVLTGVWRDKTVWTFWDCLDRFGNREQDICFVSNDGVAFPCASFNPNINSQVLHRVLSHPPEHVNRILRNSREESEALFGYRPEPALVLDENWQAANLLLLLIHPIPSVHLPDRSTAQLALRLGIDYQVQKAVELATRRLRELDEQDRAEMEAASTMAAATASAPATIWTGPVTAANAMAARTPAMSTSQQPSPGP